MGNKYLFKFGWDCGRQGDVEGLFVATEKEVEYAIGRKAYFGEILGKHSEVYGDIEEGDIAKVDIDPVAVEEVAKHLGSTWSGYNPLHYLRYDCKECGDSLPGEEMHSIVEDNMVCDYCHRKED
ncbi:hypothetical protein GRF59_14480 [Paenibacillus sp. HJL G12]|uniref:Uncharacterized protein n=1 Tax=Paenibacillus dendrobii TaxID=2691084 RepID=A0A7X3LIZ6_9BACL|nr:hypothetical protein [Paenibacillus dendrobii]MWV44824.1 hypothetical protein [Paenibacillus dendrobii]